MAQHHVPVGPGHHARQDELRRNRRRPARHGPRPGACTRRPVRPGTRARPPPRRRTAGSSIAPRDARVAASSARHSIARAPWATWGTMVSGSRVSTSIPSGGDQPSRSRAARAATTAVIPSPPTRDRRVARLPRRSAKVRSGRRLASWTRRRAEPVATVAPVARPSRQDPDQHVAGVAPLGEGRQDESGGGQLRRGGQVLGRVHRGVGVAPGHGGLDLLHEHALTAQPGERHVGAPVTLGVDHHQLGHPAGGGQQTGDALGLPHAPAASPGWPAGAGGWRRSCRGTGHRSEVEQGAEGLDQALPRGVPAASFRTTVGWWSSLATMARVTASTCSHWASSRSDRLAR